MVEWIAQNNAEAPADYHNVSMLNKFLISDYYSNAAGENPGTTKGYNRVRGSMHGWKPGRSLFMAVKPGIPRLESIGLQSARSYGIMKKQEISVQSPGDIDQKQV